MKNFKSQMTKIAALEANVDAARAALETAKAALETAQRNFDDAQKTSHRYRKRVAKTLQKDWEAVLATIPDVIVIGSQRENVQISCTADDCSISIQAWYSTHDFCFWVPGVFGWYSTPEQVKTVIELFAAAIARGDTTFIFPRVDELR